MTEKNDIFVKHIENCLTKRMQEGGVPFEIMCEECGKSIDEIYQEEKA